MENNYVYIDEIRKVLEPLRECEHYKIIRKYKKYDKFRGYKIMFYGSSERLAKRLNIIKKLLSMKSLVFNSKTTNNAGMFTIKPYKQPFYNVVYEFNMKE